MLWLWPLQEPRRVRSRSIGIWKVRIYFYCIIFKLKCVFLAPFLTTHTPNNVHFINYYENNVQSPIRTYPIIALHEHWAIFHVLELYLATQIPFFHIRLRSITYHFLENNLHLSRIRTALSSTTEKLHMELYANDSEFSTHSPAFLLFLRIKLAFSNLGINPIAC